MSPRAFLMIGGPADGVRRAFDYDVRQHGAYVAVAPPFDPRAAPGPQATPVQLRREHYTHQALHLDGVWSPAEMLVWDGLPRDQLLVTLMAGYRVAKEPS